MFGGSLAAVVCFVGVVCVLGKEEVAWSGVMLLRANLMKKIAHRADDAEDESYRMVGVQQILRSF